MTKEEKIQFIEQMNAEDREQQFKASLSKFADSAERRGILPPSGSSPEAQARREEWMRANCPRGVWTERR